jgi:D-alanine transaminase
MWVYYNGRILPKEKVCVSPDDRGFYFGDGAYDVLSVYKGRYLAEEAHYKRLQHSLEALRIPVPDVSAIKSAVNGVLVKNQLMDSPAMVYIQVTRGVAPRRHAFPDEELTPTVYITAKSYIPPEDLWANGVKVILLPDQRWGRCDIKSLNLLPNVLASQAAKEAGAYDAILHRDGVITEGSHTGVCGVLGGVLFTHPLHPCILPSVTRMLVVQQCQRLDIPCQETAIKFEALPHLDELMVLGTTTEVMPVVRVGDQTVGEGVPGPLTRRLQQALKELVGR